jgi:hypothetical protein
VGLKAGKYGMALLQQGLCHECSGDKMAGFGGLGAWGLGQKKQVQSIPSKTGAERNGPAHQQKY